MRRNVIIASAVLAAIGAIGVSCKTEPKPEQAKYHFMRTLTHESDRAPTAEHRIPAAATPSETG